MQRRKIIIVAAIGLVAAGWLHRAEGQVPSYASLYDPLQVLNLNLEMDSADWNTIKNDTSYTIVKPAYFWGENENKIVVSVRRKPTLAIGEKVSLKIDVNEYFDNQQWHGVKKLSLENGDGGCIVGEGLAWYLHRQAVAIDPGYQPPLASWVNVNVNGLPIGVYTNVEQPDKTFLRNRDLWVPDHSWLYKQGDVGNPELQAGTGSSPAYLTLDYQPFQSSPAPPTGYQTQVADLIDMRQMLLVGAVNAFTANMDELLTKGKNMFFADFDEGASGGKRLYFPWDLDSGFGGNGGGGVSNSIYATRAKSTYQEYITLDPAFHGQYDQIMQDLLAGPLSVASINGFLDQLEPVLTPSLLADPWSQIGTTPGEIAGEFNSLRQWVTARYANVFGQLQPPPIEPATASVPEPSTVALLAAAILGAAAIALRNRLRRLSRVRT